MKTSTHALFSVCSLRDDNVITSKPTWKLKHTNSILEYSECFCQISSKSLLVIFSYTVLKFRRFLVTVHVIVVIFWQLPKSTNVSWRACDIVHHPVTCEACRRESFFGLRYKCQRCYNYNLCQDCFWRGRTSGNHQNDHDVKEYSFYVRTILRLGYLPCCAMLVQYMPSSCVHLSICPLIFLSQSLCSTEMGKRWPWMFTWRSFTRTHKVTGATDHPTHTSAFVRVANEHDQMDIWVNCGRKKENGNHRVWCTDGAEVAGEAARWDDEKVDALRSQQDVESSTATRHRRLHQRWIGRYEEHHVSELKIMCFIWV